MRKLAIIGIIILIVAVGIVTYAIAVPEFRDGLYAGIEGTFLMPIHDGIVSTWVWIGNAGFAYIAAASLGITIFGFLFGYFVVYAFFYKKIYQDKIKGGTSTTGGGFQAAPSNTIPVTGLQSETSYTQQKKDENST